ncbi:MAG: hypothetical protein COZ18_05950 [Flexibacter sp. CG_4_10_14_3_um_filter_32_15]|nr:MAG: hypothetical protein COZ18_05950 [Flexibacter sp. CG_4_10_14_3_um_filter_32_15]
MATPQEIRNRRLANDYKEMENISGSLLSFEPLVGNVPYVEEYEVTIFVRSILDTQPTYRNQHKLKITLPEAYPQAPPQLELLDEPFVYHPNWFKNGRWCYGTWEMSEGLGRHMIRMIRTLQYDMEITNEHSPANEEARNWYLRMRNSGIFPCDKQEMPDPTKERAAKKTSGFKITGFGTDTTAQQEIQTNQPAKEDKRGGFRIH